MKDDKDKNYYTKKIQKNNEDNSIILSESEMLSLKRDHRAFCELLSEYQDEQELKE